MTHYQTINRSSGQESLRKLSYEVSTTVNQNDVFDHCIESYDRSKTVKVLNLIYSIIVAMLSNKVSKNFSKYSRAIGILFGILSYIMSRKFLKTQDVGEDSICSQKTEKEEQSEY